jgi:hypothetical protein
MATPSFDARKREFTHEYCFDRWKLLVLGLGIGWNSSIGLRLETRLKLKLKIKPSR